jgi:hypothetical protein
VQEAAAHEQPACEVQVACAVMPEHSVGVPVQGALHVQPAVPQRFDDVYVVHADGAPLQTSVFASQTQPMLRQLTWLVALPVQ